MRRGNDKHSRGESYAASIFFVFADLVLDNANGCDNVTSVVKYAIYLASSTERKTRDMNFFRMLRHYFALMLSGMIMLLLIGLSLFFACASVIGIGYLLSYVFSALPHHEVIGLFHFIMIAMAMTCAAGLGIPIFLLARNIQKSTESFSLMQFEEDDDMDEEEDDDADVKEMEEDQEMNDFLKKLHKTRNIGPFIPSPKTMDDLCPCGSGLKYKECCGKFWN